ncbi:MAG: hypothetical protein EOO75_07830 [Myxococcales bacterium]|nr:MAG: hypothetical protein EOO75_07830 [Myxococcales bacterium]
MVFDTILDEMIDLIPDDNPVKPLLREIEELSAYATTYRYPTSSGRVPASPGEADMAEQIARVEAALSEVTSRFAVDLSRPGLPAGKPGPIR